MADMYWMAGDTLPGIVITLNLGVDPTDGVTARTIADTDTIRQIIRTGNSAAITRTLTIVDAATNRVAYDPAVGDLDAAGNYGVEFERETADGDIETIPDREAERYEYLIGAKLAA